MLRKLTSTDGAATTTLIRLVLGIVFFAHGAQKMLGWFGGYGFSGTMGFMTGMLHIPPPFAFLAIAARRNTQNDERKKTMGERAHGRAFSAIGGSSGSVAVIACE